MTSQTEQPDPAAYGALALLYGARVAPVIVAQHLLLTATDVDPTALTVIDQGPARPMGEALHLGSVERRKADRILKRCEELGIFVMTIADPRYPPFLRVIPAAPPVLFLRGDMSLLESLPGVAVVGSREATPNGLEISRRIASYLATKGWPIVSGLAIGIDAAAHRGALDAKGKTIAVLAHGLDRASPVKNKELADEILANGGLWLSEHAPDLRPRKNFFVERNRIQAGLSAGSIIVEGRASSGSMTQAQYCLGQKRKLFAVLPPTRSNGLRLLSEGPQLLVDEQGAIPIRSLNDYEHVVDVLRKSRADLLSGVGAFTKAHRWPRHVDPPD
jgi:DNA processing protein